MNRFRRLVKQSGDTTATSVETKPAQDQDTQVDESAPVEAYHEQNGSTAVSQEGEASSSVADAPEMETVEADAPRADAPDLSADDMQSAAATDEVTTTDGMDAAGAVDAQAVDDADQAASADYGPDDQSEAAASSEATPDAAPAVAEAPVLDDATAQAMPEGEVDAQPDEAITAPQTLEVAADAPDATDTAQATGVADDAQAAPPVGDEEVSPALDDLDATEGPLLTADDGVSASDVPTGELVAAEAEDQTSPLVPVEQEELTALPVNAVVDGRYIVQSLLHHGQDRNLYRVTTRKQQRCLTCGRVVSADLETCPHCGTPLEGQPAADFYLMAESYRADALMQDPGMMESNLYHPNLVPVIDFFEHKPYGLVRYYAVAEPRQGVRLSQLSLPRPGAQVLNWAMQLSDALDYLHSRGVVGAGAEADDILVQGDRASLASLQNARANVENAEELTQQQSMDLARLASTTYEAFTGHPAAMTPEGILPMPSSAPEQVGAAFRSAIEPVQGIAPPISAARWRDLLAAALDAVIELERPGRPVSFVAAGLTNVGRLRELNEDSFGMIEFTQASVERPMRVGLYLVADGLGGHKGGEVASAIGVQAFCGEIMARIMSSLVAAPGDRAPVGNDAILQGMVRAVQSANERIYKARDNRQSDMGTTIVAVLIAGGKAYIVNVGDSRLYMYSRPHRPDRHENGNISPVVKGTSPLAGTTPLKGTNVLDPVAITADMLEVAPVDRAEYELAQVSVDHSLVHRLVELGQLDPEEAKVHPHRNFIYRSLGGPPPIEVDTFVRSLHPGDRLLLCSDGLNSMIEDTDMEEVLSTVEDTQEAAQKLIELANEAGGHDNITSIVIDVTGYLPLPEHPMALSNT